MRHDEERMVALAECLERYLKTQVPVYVRQHGVNRRTARVHLFVNLPGEVAAYVFVGLRELIGDDLPDEKRQALAGLCRSIGREVMEMSELVAKEIENDTDDDSSRS